MANPKKYVPSYSFTAPAAFFPASQLNTQFNMLSNTTSTIVVALMDVRRSDGALRNGVVTYDSLSPDLKARLYLGDALERLEAGLARLAQLVDAAGVSVAPMRFYDLRSRPTTASGFGITDVYTRSQIDALLAGRTASDGTTIPNNPSNPGDTGGDVDPDPNDGDDDVPTFPMGQGARFVKNAGQSLSSGDIAVTFQTKANAIGSAPDLSGNVYTIPETGLYAVSAGIVGTSNGGDLFFAIKKNGTGVTAIVADARYYNTSTRIAVNGAAPAVPLNAGDTLQVMVNTSGGCTIDQHPATFFEVRRIG